MEKYIEKRKKYINKINQKIKLLSYTDAKFKQLGGTVNDDVDKALEIAFIKKNSIEGYEQLEEPKDDAGHAANNGSLLKLLNQMNSLFLDGLKKVSDNTVVKNAKDNLTDNIHIDLYTFNENPTQLREKDDTVYKKYINSTDTSYNRQFENYKTSEEGLKQKQDLKYEFLTKFDITSFRDSHPIVATIESIQTEPERITAYIKTLKDEIEKLRQSVDKTGDLNDRTEAKYQTVLEKLSSIVDILNAKSKELNDQHVLVQTLKDSLAAIKK